MTKISTAIDIINAWFAFTEYDPDQHEFNLLNSEYTFHRANKQISEIFSWEPSGVLAAIYAKNIFREEMKDARVQMFQLLEHPDAFNEYHKMWTAFHSEDMIKAETVLMDRLHNVFCTISGRMLLGERNVELEHETLAKAVSAVVEQLAQLNIDVYQRGMALGDNLVQHVSPKVAVYPTLAQCVLEMERGEDRMQLCYIRNGDTADGYFGIFVKNNGNVLSFNERPDEAFVGQHRNARNGRWSDSKKYRIFPYEIFHFVDHDCKGYASKHQIDESKLSFADMPMDAYYPMILAMVLLAQKYSGASGFGKDIFIDSLLKKNASFLEEKNGKALISANTSGSLIVMQNNTFELDLTLDDVITGKAGAKYDYRQNPDSPYNETGAFPVQTADSYAQLLIDQYGDGFRLDVSALLRSDSCLRMLPSQDESEAAEYNIEFVGTKQRMQMEAYRQARAQLADYIRDRMFEEYKAFGGLKAVGEWWHNAMLARRSFIEKLCVELFRKHNIAAKPQPNDIKDARWQVEIPNDMDIPMTCYPNTNGKAAEMKWRCVSYEMIYNEMCTRLTPWRQKVPAGAFFCPETGKKASVYFIFRPKNWKQLEALAGCEVPKILKGWDENGYHEAGNSLLRATDAVLEVKTPLNVIGKHIDEGRRYEAITKFSDIAGFDIGIAWSKRGWVQVLKKYEAKEENKDS